MVMHAIIKWDMNRLRYLINKILKISMVVVAVSFAGVAQIPVEYTSVVASHASTSDFPTHYSYGTHGPFTAYNKAWVFYSDGEYAVWQTKQIDPGGDWVEGGYVFNSEHARYFNMTFDGEYFHFIRAMNNELKYLRGRANKDGLITFDPEVTAYSDPVWKVYQLFTEETYPKPRHFAIIADSDKRPWVILKVSDGTDDSANFKPIAIASVADDGSWLSRTGFPVELAEPYQKRQNGRAVTIAELEQNKILFTWGNIRTNLSDPNTGFQARIWNDGSIGPIEKTGLTWHTAATSVVVPEPGIAMINSQSEVARRNADGSWTRVDPGGMSDWDYNSLSSFNNKVRLWDYSNGNLRYRETEDNGNTWSQIIPKWFVNNMHRFSASLDAGSQGRHHSLLWSEGNNPYDIVMAIEGEYEMYYPLEAPILVSPLDSAPDLLNPVEFVWSDIQDADGYYVQIALSDDFIDVVVDTGTIADNNITLSLDYTSTFYWRVKAVSQYGTSDWSGFRSFTTGIAPPDEPLLVAPGNGNADVSIDLTFTWNVSGRAEFYHFQLADDSTFISLFTDTSDIVTSFIDITDLEYNREYFWRVAAENSSGRSHWSETWSFTTITGPPEAPLLVSPVNNSTAIATDTLLGWQESAGAETYQIQVSGSFDFDTVMYDTNGIAESFFEIANLQYGSEYFWRVRAENSRGKSPWSTVWQFTTIHPAPTAPILVSPNNGTVDVTDDVVLLWNSVSTAYSYRIQIFNSEDSSTAIIDNPEVQNTFYKPINLLAHTTYFWRVRAVNGAGEGDWSDMWSFTTGDIVSVERVKNNIPTVFSLDQNYPNPFNPVTTIRFALPADLTVRLEVYNVLGQYITTLIDGVYHTAGYYESIWDARDASGKIIPSGIYIYRITAGDFIETKSMILMK